MGSHLEEGFFINTSFFNPQMRADNQGNVYPSLTDEIMSGYLGNNNYFTKLSCGVLQDLGFSVNYNSSFIYDDSITFFPNVQLNQFGIPKVFPEKEQTNIFKNSKIINSNLEIDSKENNIKNFTNSIKYSKCSCCKDSSNNITFTIA